MGAPARAGSRRGAHPAARPPRIAPAPPGCQTLPRAARRPCKLRRGGSAAGAGRGDGSSAEWGVMAWGDALSEKSPSNTRNARWRGPCLQARLWHANSAAQNLGVVLCQTRPAANVPHPVLQQRRSVQLDAIPAGRPSHVDSFQPPHRQQLKSQYIEQNQAATHLISMHQRAFIEHVVEHLHRLAACRVARSRCCDEVALRQVRNRQPLWTIGARIDQVDLSKAG